MPSTLGLTAFALLWCAVFLQWVPVKPWFWLGFLAASIIVALLGSLLRSEGLLLIAGLGGACVYLARSERQDRAMASALAWALVLLFALLLASHAGAVFQALLIAPNLRLGTDSIPYTLRWHYDSAVAACLMLALCCNEKAPLRLGFVLTRVLLGCLVLTLTVMPLALWLGQVRVDVKLPALLLWWIPGNLLISSLSEELFFRALIQRRLTLWMRRYPRWGEGVAVVLTALLFGIAHLGGGVNYLLLATLAGVGYGTVYALTRRIEAAVLTHFLFNVIHITLFSYPRLPV